MWQPRLFANERDSSRKSFFTKGARGPAASLSSPDDDDSGVSSQRSAIVCLLHIVVAPFDECPKS